MAIQTVETVDIQYNGVTVDTYGLSDTLDNYTIDDIKNYVYCSCTNKTIRGFQEFVDRAEITLFNDSFPFFTTKLATNGRFLFDVNAGSTLPIPDGAYVFTVWLKCSNTLEMTSSNLSDAKMVTAMNAPRMKYTLPNPKGTKDNVTTWSGGDGSQCYQTGDNVGSLAYVHNIDAHNTVDIGISDIHPYMLIVLDNVVFFWRFRMDQMKFLSRPQDHGTYGHNFVGGRCVTAFDASTYSVLGTKIRTLDVTGGLAYDWSTGTGSGTSANPNAYGTADDDRIIYAEGGGNNNQTQFGCIRFYWYPNTRHEALLLWAGCGVKFYGDKLYKPIIHDGYVTGYTDNMDEPSDLDDWDGDTKHTVPPSPPSPPPSGNDEDNDDPISTVGVPFATGLAHYYVTTAASPVLEQISEAMSTWDIDATKKDLYRNLISCKLIKSPAPIPSTPGLTFTIYGVQPQYQGSGITITGVAGNPTASFGPYSIDRKFNDFRDYAPYTKCEIFLPYCGWCGLPSHIVGRSISVEYYTDIIAATCKAVVYCISGEGRNIIAEASGVIGVDIPFASENVGAKMEAANAGLVASTKGALQTAIGVGTMVASKGQKGANTLASGLSTYISGFTQMSMAANENWTEINGQTGDGCNLAGASSIIIKITRPKYGSNSEPPYVPDGYAHNIGFTSMKGITVGSVSGLLIADNVDTSNISGATERERAEIRRLLETGIIV